MKMMEAAVYHHRIATFNQRVHDRFVYLSHFSSIELKIKSNNFFISRLNRQNVLEAACSTFYRVFVMVFPFQTHRPVKMECSVATLHELYQRKDQDQHQGPQQQLADHSIQLQHKHLIIELTAQEHASCHLSLSLVSVSKKLIQYTHKNTELSNVQYELCFR